MKRPSDALLLAAALVAAGLAWGQSGKPRAPKKVPAPAPLAVPFAPGEQLFYRISWGPADAATAQMSILPGEVVSGVSVWRFQARASTIKATRFLYALDDRFDSFCEVYKLSSVQYEMSIREPNKDQDRTIRFSHDGDPVDNGATVRVPAGTRDPVALVYALRAWDWNKGKEAAFPVYEGKKLYEIRAKEIVGASPVNVPAGSYQASQIELRTFERNKELTSTRFRIWLASDAARTPVLMEADLPFGKLRVELVDTRRK